jgi:hypothetical protein
MRAVASSRAVCPRRRNEGRPVREESTGPCTLRLSVGIDT